MALAAGGLYMLLTGAQLPMQRSFAMAAFATLALLVGRRAFSLRGWAIAFAAVVLFRVRAAVMERRIRALQMAAARRAENS